MNVSPPLCVASLSLNLLPRADEVFLPLEMTSCLLWIYSSSADVNIWMPARIYAVSGRQFILFCVVLCFVCTLVDMNEKEIKGE